MSEQDTEVRKGRDREQKEKAVWGQAFMALSAWTWGMYESQGSLPGGGLEALMGSDVPFWDSSTIMLGY